MDNKEISKSADKNSDSTTIEESSKADNKIPDFGGGVTCIYNSFAPDNDYQNYVKKKK